MALPFFLSYSGASSRPSTYIFIARIISSSMIEATREYLLLGASPPSFIGTNAATATQFISGSGRRFS